MASVPRAPHSGEYHLHGHVDIWKYRHVSTEDGKKVYDQARDTWVEIPIPQVIDDETWERAQKLKKQRSRNARGVRRCSTYCSTF